MVQSNHVTRVLFCGYHWSASQTYTQEYLQNYPFIQVDEVSLDDVPNVIGKYHLCIAKNLNMDAKTISLAKEMKLIMQYGVGLEGVDIGAATKHGIKVARIPGKTGNATSCAEMAIYLMLALLRKQKKMDMAVKQKGLGEPIGETLLGKTVYIMGFGSIGSELAKRLRPFGVRIIATKRNWDVASDVAYGSGSNEDDGDMVDEKGNHDKCYDFAREADIVAPCLSMNVDTADIINADFLSSMKKGSLLVNVARAALLDYEAVYKNLKSGHLGGLGMDVAWSEPFDPEDPILKFQNVVITPHVAGVTEYAYRAMAKVVGDCALQIHAGAPFTGIEVVNDGTEGLNQVSPSLNI